jgi:hypothetical protein
MNLRTWRAGALAASIAVVLLLATQRAAGQPTGTDPGSPLQLVHQNSAGSTGVSSFPALPESGSLLLLGSAFVIVAHQLRRLI